MRFSLRSKLSIALSFVALLTLVSGFVVTGLTHGSPTGAHAAGTNFPTTLAQLKVRGTSTFKPAKTGTNPNSNIAEFGPQLPETSSKLAVGTTTGLPTTPPNPAAQSITTANPGFNGFPGISHADQRLANNGNQFSLEPPDQGLCAGNGFVVETVNDAVEVFSTTGHQILKPVTTLSSFFNLPPTVIRSTPRVFGPFVSDPKCYYDRQTQHWFLTMLEIDTDPVTGAFGTHSSTFIAVSQTSDPTALWTIYSIDSTDDGSNNTPSHAGCPCFGDQPLIGADNNGFYVTTNEFPITGPGFNGAQVYAVSKHGIIASAMSGGTLSLPAVVHIDASQGLVSFGGLSYSIQPATSPSFGAEPNNGTEYFLSALDFLAQLDNRVAAWALTNSLSLNNATPNVTLSLTVIGSETYGQPPNATQKNGHRPLGHSIGAPIELLNSNDDRMNQVVYAGGQLYAGVNTIVQNGSFAPRVGIAYFIVHPWFSVGTLNASMTNQGYVSASGQNVLFPAIGVTSSGSAIMSFTLVGPNYFPSTAYTWINLSHGAGPIHIAGAGQLPDDGFSGYAAFGGAGVGRWGDYGAAVADGNNIWIAAEFIPNTPRTQLANWGTFVSELHA
jgi:hypothetical protein